MGACGPLCLFPAAPVPPGGLNFTADGSNESVLQGNIGSNLAPGKYSVAKGINAEALSFGEESTTLGVMPSVGQRVAQKKFSFYGVALGYSGIFTPIPMYLDGSSEEISLLTDRTVFSGNMSISVCLEVLPPDAPLAFVTQFAHPFSNAVVLRDDVTTGPTYSSLPSGISVSFTLSGSDYTFKFEYVGFDGSTFLTPPNLYIQGYWDCSYFKL